MPATSRLATATADAAGEWSATSTRVVGPGRVELRLDQLGKDARVVQRIVVPMAQAAAAELTPGQAYTVQPGNNLWQISRRAYGVGTRYLIIYSANLEPDPRSRAHLSWPGVQGAKILSPDYGAPSWCRFAQGRWRASSTNFARCSGVNFARNVKVAVPSSRRKPRRWSPA